MGDSFTNFLLITLIGLIAWIGKAAYEKINEMFHMIQSMLVSHQKYESELKQMERNQCDHELRIRLLEENKLNN